MDVGKLLSKMVVSDRMPTDRLFEISTEGWTVVGNANPPRPLTIDDLNRVFEIMKSDFTHYHVQPIVIDIGTHRLLSDRYINVNTKKIRKYWRSRK